MQNGVKMKLGFLKEFDFFTGVPDSQLKPLCDYLMNTFGVSDKHIIAANEGNSTALAAGYHLATGKIPVVYLQNSGIGNVINPVVSMLNNRVYAIPCVFIVGWRGEPGVKDEPQHIFQGEVTIKLLETVGIKTFVVRKETREEELLEQLDAFRPLFDEGKSIAFVIAKDALETDVKIKYPSGSGMLREDILKHITAIAERDIIVSTTGKTSRELFEIREASGQLHCNDFLTVGSMGHSSSIALGIAVSKPEHKVWCIDGDGALLMHMGAMAVIGSIAPKNFVHVVINNGAHESVGGMPTVAKKIDFIKIAQGFGYIHTAVVDNKSSLDHELKKAKERYGLSFIEVKSLAGSRSNLGRPTISARTNKESFMEYIR
jgi:phosphonopyruvate decarboxylase